MIFKNKKGRWFFVDEITYLEKSFETKEAAEQYAASYKRPEGQRVTIWEETRYLCISQTVTEYTDGKEEWEGHSIGANKAFAKIKYKSVEFTCSIERTEDIYNGDRVEKILSATQIGSPKGYWPLPGNKKITLAELSQLGVSVEW